MKQRSSVAEEIALGLEEILAFEQGKISLNTRQVQVPEPPKQYSAQQIRELRERLGYSQALMARVVGVSTDAVRSWEQGLRIPSRAAARVLDFLNEPALLKKLTGIGKPPKKTRSRISG